MRVKDRELSLESAPPFTGDVRGASLAQLKQLMRSTSIGLDDPVRDWLWIELSLRHSCSVDTQFDGQFDSQLQTNKLPKLVEPRLARFYSLQNKQELTQVLWHLQQSCPHVTYAPLVYPLASLLLHFHSPEDVYKSLYALINAKDVHFLGVTRSDKARDAIILVKLTNKFGILRPRKFGADAREKLRNNALDTAFAEYLEWIVCLPFHHMTRVIDCFLVEGEKFLFRVALTLALLFEKQKKTGITLEKMRSFCESIASLITPSQLIQNALKITRLSRKDIQRAKVKAEQRSESVSYSESPLHSYSDRISTKDYVLGARIAPRRFKSSVVDNWSLLDVLWEWLPERVIVKEPAVVFCSEENGLSLQTFFTLCGDYEPTVLLIKTIKNEIFGAFCSAAWSQRLDVGQTRSGQYFGTGETFLFTLWPKAVKYEWIGRHSQHISHSQQLFQSATSRSLIVGSGGGRFGLFIDESLTRGQSDCCETFANQPLSSGNVICVRLSIVFGFGLRL